MKKHLIGCGWFLSLTSDITMAHFGTEGTAAQDWFGAMRDATYS